MDSRVKAGLIDARAEKRAVLKGAEDVLLDAGRLEHQVKLLSGGNQQKAIIAKALLVDADLMLLDEPTRGVDIGAREEIYQVIRKLAEKGKTIVLVSSDWDELIALCDRMLVMAEGRITGELSGAEITQERIMHLSSIAHVTQANAGGGGAASLRERLHRIFRGARAAPQSPAKATGRWNLVGRLGAYSRGSNTTMLALILLAFVVIGLSLHPSFRTWINTRNLMSQAMPFFLLTLGQLVVIIAGGLDLSVGALVASSSVLGMTIMLQNPDNVLARRSRDGRAGPRWWARSMGCSWSRRTSTPSSRRSACRSCWKASLWSSRRNPSPLRRGSSAPLRTRMCWASPTR